MPGPYKTVMLIDEDEIDNLINQKVIEANEFAEQTLLFNAAEKALEYLEAHVDKPKKLPQIIFLDINMPIMDGFAFLEAFAKLPQPILDYCQIIMLSSSISPLDIDRAAGSPYVKKYFNKPLNERYLKAI